MLAQICERSLIEHPLAARHFKFLNFCEQPCPPGSPLAPLTTHTASDRATIQGCSLSPSTCWSPPRLSWRSSATLTVILIYQRQQLRQHWQHQHRRWLHRFAALSVFWNCVERLLNFKSRIDMHGAANQLCKELLRDLDFTLVRYQSLSNVERNDSEKPCPWGEQALRTTTKQS